MLNIKSLMTKDLSQKNIRDICLLKNKHWKYNLDSQLDYFKKNFNKKDIHICVFEFDRLIAYNALRRKQISLGNLKKKYLLFDTLIVSEINRDRGISTLMMIFNSLIIKKYNLIAFLLCEKNLIKFYEKFGWVKKNKKKINLKSNFNNKSYMFFNIAASTQFNINYKRNKINLSI